METVPTHKKFSIIHEMADNLISIQELCKIAGVSRSGYYNCINASLRMYKSDWIRMYNFDFNMHTDFEVKWCACKFENHNRD